MDQVPVCGMNLHHFESGSTGACRGVGERDDQLADLTDGHLLGRRQITGGDRGRPDGAPTAAILRQGAALLPWHVGRRLAPGVRELHPGDGAPPGDEAVDAGERIDLFVVPESGVAQADPTLGGDRGGLGQQQPGTALGEGAQVH